jgi:SM-20-related protein
LEELTLSCYGLDIRVVDAAGARLCERLQNALPPEFTVSSAAKAAVEYVVKAGAAERTRYRITYDGVEGLDAADEEEALHCVQQQIDYTIARRSVQKLFVHAGVVAWRGLAIVIPGRTLTGKSSLVAEFVRRGALYCSDEFAVLDDMGNVHPYRRALVLREEGKQHPEDLHLRWDTASTEPLPVGLIVAAPYRPGVAWRPAIVRGTRAVLPLIEATILARQESARIVRIAARISPVVVTLAGPRPDATEVAPRILDLVDDALVSRSLATTGTHSNGFAADLAAVAEVRLRSQTARPTPPRRELLTARYVRIADFLSEEEHQRVFDQALAHQDAFEDSGILDDHGGHRRNYGIRKSRTLSGRHLEAVSDLFDRRLRGMLPSVRRELGLSWFPLGEIERQLTVHADGGFFAPHRDTGHPVVANRRISCIYYFHANPRRFTGGELKLYDSWVTDYGTTPAATYTTIAPLDNSLVFFASDTFHEVCPVQREIPAFRDSRFAVTIWFREGKWPERVADTEPHINASEAGRSGPSQP